MSHLALMWICMLALPVTVTAPPPISLFEVSSQDIVDIETIDGPLRSEIPTIGMETSEIRLQERNYPIRDILSLRFRNDQNEAQPRDLIILRNQSRWRGKLLLSPDRPADTLQWITPSLTSPLLVSLDDLLQYSTATAPSVPFPQPVIDSDQLLTKEGALLSGILEELRQDGIRFDDPSLGSLVIPWPKILAFRLVEVPIEQPVTQNGRIPILIRTLDQSLVRGHLIQIDAQKVVFTRISGLEKEISLKRVVDVHFEMGRVVPLAQRDPVAVTEGAPTTTWFPWTWKKDRNVLGNPLQIGGISYERGIGVHSKSHLTYSIDKGDQFLIGIAGMDISSRPADQQEGIGCAEFRILVDGTERWNGGVLSWKSPGNPFRIPLEGAQSFTLVVDLGPGHHILDRANWAQIRIIRK